MSAQLEPTFEGDFTFAAAEPFQLATGGELQPVNLRYALYGELDRARSNAILVCHALSGSARVADWWPALVGPHRLFDTTRFCIIGSNVIGSCYGSTGPTALHPGTHKPYAADFPLITIRDMVRAQARLIEHLDIERLHAVVGGSIGGMQALQWAVDFPTTVARCIAIGATELPALGLALNHLQRQAITNDPHWRKGYYPLDQQPAAGLALARALAMCSYKSAELFDARYQRRPNRTGEDPYRLMSERFDVAGYLDYQGASFTRRFDANAYLTLLKAMDTFELARGYESGATALRRIKARVQLIGISSDWLFPAADVRALDHKMQAAGVNVSYRELQSAHGHDAFLADAELLAPLLAPFVNDAASTPSLTAHAN